MHGRNRVTRAPDGTVVKHHGGPEGGHRAATAAAALRTAADHALPTPRLHGVDGPDLTMDDMDGATTGARLLARRPATVLHAIGGFARQLHDLPPPSELLVAPAAADGRAAVEARAVPGARAVPDAAGAPDGTAPSDAVWVHGDLCPVNVLFDDDGELVGVVDWEDSHVGDPLVDLVWTEWLVRVWHEPAVAHLAALYDAYGAPPADAEARREAMRACLARHGAREAEPTARAAWDRRVVELADLDLSL